MAAREIEYRGTVNYDAKRRPKVNAFARWKKWNNFILLFNMRTYPQYIQMRKLTGNVLYIKKDANRTAL